MLPLFKNTFYDKYRNINLFPFRQVEALKLPPEDGYPPCPNELPRGLGPTDSWPIAVLTKPFSTSVFKVLIWILATTTKICTRGLST